jgi:hypothetical protein
MEFKMIKKFTLNAILIFLMLSMTNSAYSNSSIILRDGIGIGTAAAIPAILTNDARPGLAVIAIGTFLSKPKNKEEWAGKIGTSLATWLVISMLKPAKSKKKKHSCNGDSCDCRNNH